MPDLKKIRVQPIGWHFVSSGKCLLFADGFAFGFGFRHHTDNDSANRAKARAQTRPQAARPSPFQGRRVFRKTLTGNAQLAYNSLMPKPDLSTTEAAEMLKVSKRTILNMIERGSLHAQKIDPAAKSVYRIPHSEVERILRERENPRSQPAGK
jgi:excisionase family DNA binding protein